MRVHRLLREFREGLLRTEDFCSQFEHAYNLELDKAELSERERLAFAPLFEVVVWFSPFPEERAQIPNYRSEEDVSRAAADAANILGGGEDGSAAMRRSALLDES
jgi:hypothetical protein